MVVRATPPGPRERFPGDTILTFWRDPPAFLQTVAARHGDVAHIRWGFLHEYLLNHPELTRRVLVAEQSSFMKGQALQEAKRVLGDGLLTSEGAHHRRQRRLLQPLFHGSRVEGYAATMAGCAERLSRRWREGDVVDVHEEMARLTLTIVGRTLFSADVEAEAPEIGEALTDAIDSIRTLMVPGANVVEALPIPPMRRLRRAQERLDRTIYRLIRDRDRTDERPDDVLSALLDARDEAGLTERQIRDEAMTLFIAGHETTAAALTWTWLLLARHPDVEERLHAEIDETVGGRTPGYEDLSRLPYTRMVLSEALRLYPPAWLIGRRALADFEADGYVVPAGAIVILSPYVSQRDSRWFPEPNRFDPDRWPEERRGGHPRWAYFPFGGGPRTCLGEGFAWTELQLVLATLARRWRPRQLPGRRVELHPRVTLRPKGGLPMRLERR
jgi:cytochrome P450